MILVHSDHWKHKQQFRPEITDDLIEYIEYAIQNSNELRDKHWDNASNAVSSVPPMGRLLKVVYKRIEKNTIKIITAFWLD